MGVRVERVDLSGIGFRDDIITAEGARLGVLTHRDGSREVAIYSAEDPDATAASLVLTAAEASALAVLLGEATLIDQLSKISDTVPGIFTEHLSLPADSKYIDAELGDTHARSKTGVSVVAIVRELTVIASPKPNQDLMSGDILVAVGTRAGLDEFAEILSNTRG
ncbi:MAG: antiporter subunit KhtT [Actinomycetota bacterium]|jgi:TrkA domain protein